MNILLELTNAEFEARLAEDQKEKAVQVLDELADFALTLPATSTQRLKFAAEVSKFSKQLKKKL